MGNLCINHGKQEVVMYQDIVYRCYAIKTHVITSVDDLTELVLRYAKSMLQRDDILFISEKMVACTQGRAIPLDEIEAGKIATWLSRFVSKTPAGIGLGMPETMQCAINACGLVRILAAAAAGAMGKALGRRGWFYQVAGDQAAGIDGPCSYTLPPYNACVVLAPANAQLIARNLAKMLGNTVLIVDLNDLGGKILASSDPALDERKTLALLRQNPLGQSDECTPMGILRPLRRSRSMADDFVFPQNFFKKAEKNTKVFQCEVDK